MPAPRWFSKSPLTSAPFANIPLGSVKARGWLLTVPITSKTSPPTSFKADFNDNTLKGWVLYGGNCSVRNGQFSLAPDDGFLTTVVPGLSFGDLTVEADMVVGDKGNGGLVLRADKGATGPDAYQGYYVGIDASRKPLLVGKADGQNWHSLGAALVAVEAGKSVRLKVVAKGDRFTDFVGESQEPVQAFTDSSYARGTIGIREYGANLFTVDNVSAQAAAVVRWR